MKKKRNKPETFLFSAQIDGETSNKFNDIATAREQSKAQVLRDWINRAHKALSNKTEAA
jgi:hypothetical protein